MKKIYEEKIKQLISTRRPDWAKEEDFIEENEDWLEMSSKIAIKVNCLMREKNISKIELKKTMKIPTIRLDLILKGQCNLTLRGIAKLEKALDTPLIEVS